MKRIFILILSFLFFSCVEKKEKINGDYITIIFKNPQVSDTTFFGKKAYTIDDNKVYYKFKNDFVNNTIKVGSKDTTIIIKSSNPIYVYHKYFIKDYCMNSYCFYPNDTITFEYKNGVPFAISNRKGGYSYNFNSSFNIKYPLDFDDYSFFMKYKRFKTKKELKNDSIIKVKRDLKQIVFFDSLKNNKLIDRVNYDLNLQDFKNKDVFKSITEMEILKKTYNLGDNANANLINIAFEKIFKPRIITLSDGKMPNFKEQFENIFNLNKISPTNKEYLMFYYLETLGKRGYKEDFLKCFEKYKKETQKKSVINYFKNKYPLFFEYESSDNMDILLFNKKKEKNTLTQIIQSHKGKVIYIDFWASWCGPCRALMPSSRNLHDEYKDEKVEFIYISIDDDEKNWKSATQKEQLTNSENNFLSINYPKANLYQKLIMKTIPRFIIYDKKGNLVNSNAPNPDSKEIKDELDKYLNQ